MSSIHSYGGDKSQGKQPEIEEIELSLSLSLNGKFGVAPNAKVEKTPPSTTGYGGGRCSSPLVRTCSVQVGKGGGKNKEDEIHLIKKMAKRKRMERMSIVRGVREKIDDDGYVGSKSIHENEVNCNFYGYGRGLGNIKGNDLFPPPPPLGVVFEESDEGSSPGCGSSDVSDNNTGHQAIQAPNISIVASSPLISPPENIEHKVAVISKMDTPGLAAADREMNESKKKLLIKAMGNGGWPYVFTSLDSPNHVKIEGFLHKYGSGQPVKIVCICHGMYHSPAEFVKHAGGDAIENPLKHIVVILPSAS